MDHFAMFFAVKEGFGGIARIQHGVSLLLQHVPDKGADSILILYQENGLSATIVGGNLTVPTFRWAIDARKKNLEDSAYTYLAIDPNIAVALLDNSVNGRQAKAGPLAHLFRSEKGFENASHGGFIHANTGVAYR